MPNHDVVIIGSGLSGVHAAYEPVQKGLRVLMLDVGIERETNAQQNEKTFEQTRALDPDQYRIFLGDDFSGIGAEEGEKGHGASMASGSRAHVMRDVDVYGRVEKNGTEVNQSFARGGLSEIWSGVCDIFDESELRAASIPHEKMNEHYQRVIDRIGVSGRVRSFHLQSPPHLDDSAYELFRRYSLREARISRLGFRVIQPLYAMLTSDLKDRKAQSYRDMDFWDNTGRTVYRARYTLEELEQKQNFTYVGGLFAERVEDTADHVTVSTRDIQTGEQKIFTGKTLIAASGAINTTRLLLCSFGAYETPVSIILKKNHLISCLFPARFGTRSDPRRHSFAQLALHGMQKVHGMSELYAQVVGYNSLLLHRLLRYIPLPTPQAFSILSVLAPAMIMIDVRLPSLPHLFHRATLRKASSGDYFHFEYPEDDDQEVMQKRIIASVKKAARRLGLVPLKTVSYPYGSASQYAGGVPHFPTPSDTLSVNERGQVHGHERIFVADAASWTALPARPSGLTVMANADRVGSEVARFVS